MPYTNNKYIKNSGYIIHNTILEINKKLYIYYILAELNDKIKRISLYMGNISLHLWIQLKLVQIKNIKKMKCMQIAIPGKIYLCLPKKNGVEPLQGVTVS